MNRETKVARKTGGYDTLLENPARVIKRAEARGAALPMTLNPGAFYTLRETGRIMRCSYSTVKTRVAAGAFPVHRLPGKCLISGADLKAYLESLRSKTSPEVAARIEG